MDGSSDIMLSAFPMAELEEKIGYVFTDKTLLAIALTHTSYINETRHGSHGTDNERLEFLGDSVLSLTVTEYLFKNAD
ncbi:MAG TPA: hypothetical protein PLT66_04605, partial [Bacillota bacterium]|nr:hypothetical protein [Bacillota bacterium]